MTECCFNSRMAEKMRNTKPKPDPETFFTVEVATEAMKYLQTMTRESALSGFTPYFKQPTKETNDE